MTACDPLWQLGVRGPRQLIILQWSESKIIELPKHFWKKLALLLFFKIFIQLFFLWIIYLLTKGYLGPVAKIELFVSNFCRQYCSKHCTIQDVLYDSFEAPCNHHGKSKWSWLLTDPTPFSKDTKYCRMVSVLIIFFNDWEIISANSPPPFSSKDTKYWSMVSVFNLFDRLNDHVC